MGNPLKLIDINAVTMLSSNQLQLLFLDGQRSYTVAHDSENRAGAADTTKVYLFTCTSGHPQGIVANDNESQSSLNGDFTSGINISKIKLLSGRSIGIGPNVSTMGYIASGNGSPTFLVAPDVSNYGRI